MVMGYCAPTAFLDLSAADPGAAVMRASAGNRVLIEWIHFSGGGAPDPRAA